MTNRCHTCKHWRRLSQVNCFGLCTIQKGRAHGHDAVGWQGGPIAGLPWLHGVNLPEKAVITGFAFGCIHHTSNPPAKEEPGSFC